MHSEYIVLYHDKGRHNIYRVVPRILSSLLDEHRQLEGVSVGGSYANGTWSPKEDVDMFAFYRSYPHRDIQRMIDDKIIERFASHSLRASIRFTFAANTIIPAMLRKHIHRHTETPFVMRTREAAVEWGLLEG